MALAQLTADLRKQLTCPICLGKLKKPKQLPCSRVHVFCRECLKRLLVRDGDHQEQAVIRCPLCRRVTPVEGVLPADHTNLLLEV